MQAAVEALRDGVATDTDRYYRSLERDVAALHSLVDDVFLLARLQAGDLTLDRVPTDLSDLADEAIHTLERDLGEMPGVYSACVNDRARHLMLVDYDPEGVRAGQLLPVGIECEGAEAEGDSGGLLEPCGHGACLR